MNRDTFLKSVTVLDTETTNLSPENAEIVEIGGASYDGKTWNISSMLMGAANGIPPEASAKNNISNRMIDGLPLFGEVMADVKKIFRWNNSLYYVAHNSQYDQKVLKASFSRINLENDADIAIDNANWICTHRLAKQIIDFDFADMQYNLSYLRYRLDLPVPDSAGVHRAGDDTLTCALLFEFLVDFALAKNLVTNTETIGKQLHDLCWGFVPMKVFPFGKNKGKTFSEIPTDYYLWALKNMDSLKDTSKSYDPDLAENIRIELEKRIN